MYKLKQVIQASMIMYPVIKWFAQILILIKKEVVSPKLHNETVAAGGGNIYDLMLLNMNKQKPDGPSYISV